MRVKSCVASDGSGHVINLSDEFGCVLRPKMISRFLKARAPDERATVITYAFFHAFKFPDALSVHIKCKVEICRHGCLDHCQNTAGGDGASLSIGSANERKDVHMGDTVGSSSSNDLLRDLALPPASMGHGPQSGQHGMGNMGMGLGLGLDHDIFYEDIIHDHKQTMGGAGGSDQYEEKSVNLQPRPVHENPDEEADLSDLFGDDDLEDLDGDGERFLGLKKSGKFPHGPRQLEAQKRMGVPMAGPRSLEPKSDMDDVPRPVYRPQAEALKKSRDDHIDLDEPTDNGSDADDTQKSSSSSASASSSSSTSTPASTRRRRRSLVISDRKVRSADVGVSGLYDVISEADLAFRPIPNRKRSPCSRAKSARRSSMASACPCPASAYSSLWSSRRQLSRR